MASTEIRPSWRARLNTGRFRNYFLKPEKVVRPHIVMAMRVLDLGCGDGCYTVPMAAMTGPYGHIWAIDTSADAVKATETNVQRTCMVDRITVRQASQNSLGVSDLNGQIDLVFAFNMLHEVQDLPKFFSEAIATLTVAGQFFVAEPATLVSAQEFERRIAVANELGAHVVVGPKIDGYHTALLARDRNFKAVSAEVVVPPAPPSAELLAAGFEPARALTDPAYAAQWKKYEAELAAYHQQVAAQQMTPEEQAILAQMTAAGYDPQLAASDPAYAKQWQDYAEALVAYNQQVAALAAQAAPAAVPGQPSIADQMKAAGYDPQLAASDPAYAQQWKEYEAALVAYNQEVAAQGGQVQMPTPAQPSIADQMKAAGYDPQLAASDPAYAKQWKEYEAALVAYNQEVAAQGGQIQMPTPAQPSIADQMKAAGYDPQLAASDPAYAKQWKEYEAALVAYNQEVAAQGGQVQMPTAATAADEPQKIASVGEVFVWTQQQQDPVITPEPQITVPAVYRAASSWNSVDANTPAVTWQPAPTTEAATDGKSFVWTQQQQDPVISSAPVDKVLTVGANLKKADDGLPKVGQVFSWKSGEENPIVTPAPQTNIPTMYIPAASRQEEGAVAAGSAFVWTQQQENPVVTTESPDAPSVFRAASTWDPAAAGEAPETWTPSK